MDSIINSNFSNKSSDEALKAKRIKTAKKIIFTVLFYLAVAVFLFWMILPFFWSLLTSLRPADEISTLNVSFLPKKLVFDHYMTIFVDQAEHTQFVRRFFNTVFVTVAGVFTNLFFGSLAGYAFSKLRFKGHKIIFNIMLISLMIPGVITLVPTFLVIVRFPLFGGNNLFGNGGYGLYGNHLALILPGAVGVYGIFFMRQFFMTLSDELAESARIDGAGEFMIFFRIYLPLVLPALLTLGIFTFQGGWNNFMWPSIVLAAAPEKWLLTQIFSVFKSNAGFADYGALMALSILMALPVLIFFIAAQKWFIQGVALGGVKG